MRRFLLKMTSVFTFIIAVMALEGWLLGHLPIWGMLALLPAFGLLTVRLFVAGTRPVRRRSAQRPAARVARKVQPALRVVSGGRQSPDGPRVA